MAALLGKWTIVDIGENAVDIIKSIGIEDEEKIEAIKNSNPTWELTQDGDSYTTTITSPEGTKTDTWKSGEEFDSKNLADADIKSTMTLEGDNVLVEVSTHGDVTHTLRREAEGDEMKLTHTVGEISNISTWKKGE